MPAPAFSKFETLLLTQRNPVGISVLLVLGWMASSDGALEPAEADHLAKIAAASGHSDLLGPIENVLRSGDTGALQLACEYIGLHCRGAEAYPFINLAIGMAVAGGRFGNVENHILRFLADLIGLSPDALRYEFSRVTGQPLPEPADPSRASFWETKIDPMTRHAYAVLGLEGLAECATPAQIRAAYRRLARAHHPDRFVQLGPEAVATATCTFQRIQSAYEYLVPHA